MTLSSAAVRFDDARVRALAVAREVAAEGPDVLLVRDVTGRYTLLVDDRDRAAPADRPTVWERRLAEELGRYVTDRPLILASGLFSAEHLLASSRAFPDLLQRPRHDAGAVRLLDNTVVGEEWAHVSVPTPDSGGSRTHRTALYGFKGGVGRTTATAILARHLADQGYMVLVVDLDLESPGAGPLLAGEERLPLYGVVDQLVESAVDNADGLDLVARGDYVPATGRGEIWVAPARGRQRLPDDVPYSYVDKLNRVYADTPGAHFGDRLENAVRACEDAVEREGESGRRPDVVLLDSRAGIHDIAAVTISRLCDLALLFGADNRQTWSGYGDLFTAWHASGQAQTVREKLRMVASMVPDSPQRPPGPYLRSFRERSWETFSVLYDDDAPEPDTGELVPGAFFPTPEDDSAPHYPIPILFEPGLVGLDTNGAPGWQERAFVQAAYQEFLAKATRLITTGPENGGM